MTDFNLKMRDIYSARARIAPIARKTPLVSSPVLSELTGSEVTLKLENLQVTGSFKPRGAAMAFALERHHLVVEGAGAVGIAALMSRKILHVGKHIAVVISGANIDMALLLRIAQEHLDGR